jgi:hypothetical protein
MMECSMSLMVTGSSLMLRTQDSSHGAGQMRPVNSGKLFVACSAAIAFLPVAAVHEVVPVGDDVAERAAVVTKRDAAVHAARALEPQLLLGHRVLELAVVPEPIRDLGSCPASRGRTP